MRKVLILSVGLLGLAACQTGPVGDQSSPTTTTLPATTATTATTVVQATTTVAPTSTTTRPSTTTTRPVTTTTTRPITTTTTRPLTRAEATSKLCASIKSGDDAVQQGSYVRGALRLGNGISSYEATADPAVVAGAKAMLRTGVRGDAEGYSVARISASDACALAGFPIYLSGPIVCFTGPCP